MESSSIFCKKNKCHPQFYNVVKDDNSGEMIDTEVECLDYDQTNCLHDLSYREVYDNVDWEKLKRSIKGLATAFVNELNGDQKLLESIKEIYGDDITQFRYEYNEVFCLTLIPIQ